jgi:hypothetical protein
MNFRRTIATVIVVTMASFTALAQHRTGNGAGGLIPAGTQVTIRFIDNLTSETAHEGDTFHATLEEPIVVGERILYSKGADVTGRVTYAHPSGRLSDPGELELVLTEISTGARWYPLASDPYRIKGESHSKSNVTKIGGGTALGALIGAIAGGGKGATIGAGVGAAAGTGTAAATGKKEAKIESEAVLTFLSAGATQTQSPVTETARRDDGHRSDSSLTSYDDPRGRPFRAEFTGFDRREVRTCFNVPSNLPPGLAERESLPPGLEKQLQRNGTLPPGLVKHIRQLPDACTANLPRLPRDWGRVLVGRHVLLLDPDNRVVDMFELDGQD